MIQLKHKEKQNPRIVNSISQLNIMEVPEREENKKDREYLKMDRWKQEVSCEHSNFYSILQWT